jgi:hypothetical protein
MAFKYFSDNEGQGLCNASGVAQIRIAKRCHVDFAALNNARDYFYGEDRAAFLKPLPLKDGKKWVNLDCDFEGLERQTTQVEGTKLHDLVISDLTFRFNYIQCLNLLLKTDFVVVSLYQSGRIWIDGIDYDIQTQELSYTPKIPVRITGVRTTSKVFRDPTGEQTVFSITGRQRDKGKLGSFKWSDFETPLNLSFGVYSLGTNITFQLPDGSVIIW